MTLDQKIQAVRNKNKSLQLQGIQLECSIDRTNNQIILNKIIINRVYESGEVWITIPSEIDIIRTLKEFDYLIKNNQNKTIKRLSLSNFNSNLGGSIGKICECGLEELDLTDFDFGRMTSISHLCSAQEQLKTIKFKRNSLRNITDAQYMFDNCIRIQEIDFRNTGMVNIVNAENMFGYCYDLEHIYFPMNQMQHVQNWKQTFTFCYALKDDMFKNIRFDSGVRYFRTFYACLQLKNVVMRTIRDRSAQVLIMAEMVQNSCDIEVLDVHKLDTSHALSNKDLAWNQTNFKTMIVNSQQFLAQMQSSAFSTYRQKQDYYRFELRFNGDIIVRDN